jgi:hypothetical protein
MQNKLDKSVQTVVGDAADPLEQTPHERCVENAVFANNNCNQ